LDLFRLLDVAQDGDLQHSLERELSNAVAAVVAKDATTDRENCEYSEILEQFEIVQRFFGGDRCIRAPAVALAMVSVLTM
jgi:hypothetical protein